MGFVTTGDRVEVDPGQLDDNGRFYYLAFVGTPGTVASVDGKLATVEFDNGRSVAIFRHRLRLVEPIAGPVPGGWGTETVDQANPKDLIGVTKPALDLVPAALDLHASMAMKNGADKYGPFNWREKPVRASIYIAAARRHLAAWLDGENVAADSGVHHLGHAAACLAILLDAEANGNLIDDRPPPGPAGRLIAELTTEREP